MFIYKLDNFVKIKSNFDVTFFFSDYCKKCTLIANLFLDNYHCCMPKCKFCYYYSFMLVKNRIKEISNLIVLSELHNNFCNLKAFWFYDQKQFRMCLT